LCIRAFCSSRRTTSAEHGGCATRISLTATELLVTTRTSTLDGPGSVSRPPRGPQPAYRPPHGAVQVPDEGARTMGDKSPKQSMTKKASGKSIKEKRIDRKAKADTTSQMENLTHGKK
jgi:hypothetical protein